MNNERGYTLAEMMVVCAIVGLVMASLLGLIMSGQQAYWYGTTQVDGQQAVRVAIERMAKDIREAGYEPLVPETNPVLCPNGATYPLYPLGPSCYKFVPITSQSATAMTLQYNWDGSTAGTHITVGSVADPMCPAATPLCRGEQVTYALAGGTLTRHETVDGGTAEPIASGITGLTFTYRDADNNVTASRDLIRIVEISITAQTANKGAHVTMIDRIRLRNR